MIVLRLPGDHPHQPIISKWAQDKESILTSHSTQIQQLQNVLKNILGNNPELGKPFNG
jgi:hypothetical protein